MPTYPKIGPPSLSSRTYGGEKCKGCGVRLLLPSIYTPAPCHRCGLVNNADAPELAVRAMQLQNVSDKVIGFLPTSGIVNMFRTGGSNSTSLRRVFTNASAAGALRPAEDRERYRKDREEFAHNLEGKKKEEFCLGKLRMRPTPDGRGFRRQYMSNEHKGLTKADFILCLMKYGTEIDRGDYAWIHTSNGREYKPTTESKRAYSELFDNYFDEDQLRIIWGSLEAHELFDILKRAVRRSPVVATNDIAALPEFTIVPHATDKPETAERDFQRALKDFQEEQEKRRRMHIPEGHYVSKDKSSCFDEEMGNMWKSRKFREYVSRDKLISILNLTFPLYFETNHAGVPIVELPLLESSLFGTIDKAKYNMILNVLRKEQLLLMGTRGWIRYDLADPEIAVARRRRVDEEIARRKRREERDMFGYDEIGLNRTWSQ